MSMSQVLVVDHHPLLRTGIAIAIRSEPGLDVVAEVGSAADAVCVLKQRPVDIAIIPVLMPASSGLALTPRLLEIKRDLRILALSTLGQPQVIAAMLRAGAAGYAVKTQRADEIAARLFISRRTVETHRQRISHKLGMHSLLDLVRLAAREGALIG
jgi:DNA-binding NarL/FixJ family response regulator